MLHSLIVVVFFFFFLFYSLEPISLIWFVLQVGGEEQESVCNVEKEKENKSFHSLLYTLPLPTTTPTSKKKRKTKETFDKHSGEQKKIPNCCQLHHFLCCCCFFSFYVLLTKEHHDYTTDICVCVDMAICHY